MRWAAVESENDDFSPETGPRLEPSSRRDAGEDALPWDRRLGLYALIQPFVGGRRAIELWPAIEGDGEHLRAAGATEVASLAPQAPSLPMEEAAVDLVICPNFLPVATADAAAPWLREIARVLAPGGLCVVRAPAGSSRTWIPEGVFSETKVVDEVAFGGVSFRVAGTEDLAIVGDLSPLTAPADFEIWIAGVTPGSLPELAESALVPLPGFSEPGATVSPSAGSDERTGLSGRLAELESALVAAERARDEARLAAAAQGDRDALAQTTVTSLRATVERQLRQLADVEVTLARMTTERDEAISRSDAAEARVHTAEAALRRREWEIEALKREVQRLGRTPGPER